MKNFNGTVTLSLLDEDNSQRIIFRIIPLCTKNGHIFQGRKASYPDYGSLRIIPDKREQSSFKDRMRGIGNLCCVQLLNEGKELTKIRQNRNYDPNQGECNQYAIYSDVVCGFEADAVFEVYQEADDISHALTETVLIQRGKVLYGPVQKQAQVQLDLLRPFGNEKYLLHTVEDLEGESRTFYWNPDAVVTWRQRKKQMKTTAEETAEAAPEPEKVAESPVLEAPQAKAAAENETPQTPQPEAQPTVSDEAIPIGAKLELLDTERTNDEHISVLNQPVSVQANLLDHNDKPRSTEVPADTPQFSATPITQLQKNGNHDKPSEKSMHAAINRQLLEQQAAPRSTGAEQRPVYNPLDHFRSALQDVWQIPALHQDCIKVLAENGELTKTFAQAACSGKTGQPACTVSKAEMDEIESKRLSLLIELDKVKANYDQIKEKMFAEMSRKKQDEIDALAKQVQALKDERQTLEDLLTQTGNNMHNETLEYLASKATTIITSNGSDITISPTVGCQLETQEIVEFIRSSMSSRGFKCKQDCVTEFMVLLSLYDEICIYAKNMWEAELYVKYLLQALGLTNVTAWPGVFGTLRIISFLPENDLRTPTVEVIKNNRAPIQAYGHKVFRLIEKSRFGDVGITPVIQMPEFNTSRDQQDLNGFGKPLSLHAIHAFGNHAALLHKDGEAWFENMEAALAAEGLPVPGEVLHAMRVFVRMTVPQLIGGFSEAADAAMLAWIVPMFISRKLPKDKVMNLIGDLPRCVKAMNAETY